jgi:adenylate cyclase
VEEVVAVAVQARERARLYRADSTGHIRQVLEFGAQGPADPASIEAGPTALSISGEAWIREARTFEEPGWVDIARTPGGEERAVAYVDPSGGALLAAMIGYSRFAELLGDIPVGRTGRSYVLGPNGAIIIASHNAEKAPRLGPLDAVALAAGRLVAARQRDALNVSEKTSLRVGGADYAVGLSPLWFQGWQLAVVVPEAEFLAQIEATIQTVALGLALFVLVAGAVGVAAARRFVGIPIAKVVGDLGHVERFELEQVPRRRSRLVEIDRLSEAISRMSLSLADFAKFIPTDLVRSLVAEGVRAEPGGSRREITVLFADLAGFTRLSEELGDEVVPVVSRFLDAASQAIAAEGGTVDKYIGDAVMAFWNAPRTDPDHAYHACRAAIAIASALETLDLPPRVVQTLRVRIGIQTGPAIVGNVGSTTRLNYTALGDTVNQASRFEGVNKVYGTTVLIGSTTRQAVHDRLRVREIDTVAVYGRVEGVTLFELIEPTGVKAHGKEDVAPAPAVRLPDWARLYECALAAYRERRFADALGILDQTMHLRPGDGPSARLAQVCRHFIADAPSADWQPITMLDMK